MAKTYEASDGTTFATQADAAAYNARLGTNPSKSSTSSPTRTTSQPSVIPSRATAQPPTSALQPGMTGTAVKQLQDYLVSQGVMTQAQVNTGYGTYGPQTTAAVKALQAKLGVNNASGPGYYGPQTISAVQRAPQTTPQTTATASQRTTSTYPSTANPEMDAVQDKIKTLTDQLASNGQLPANLQITPDITSKFLSWAHQVVDPQTKQLLDAHISNINAELGNAQKQYEASQGQIVQDFGTNLATEQNTAGGAGTAFSGQRALNENNMVNSTNRTLSSLASNASLNIGNTLRSGAANVGSANATRFNLPTLGAASVSNTGGQRGTSMTGGGLDFGYNPDLYTVGNIPSSQAGVLAAKQQDYQSQYYNLASKNPTRSVNDLLGGITNRPL